MTCTCTVLKLRMRIEVTRFRNSAAQFRNWVAVLKSEDNFEIGTQFRNFQIAQRNFEIAQIYKSRGTETLILLLHHEHLLLQINPNLNYHHLNSVSFATRAHEAVSVQLHVVINSCMCLSTAACGYQQLSTNFISVQD